MKTARECECLGGPLDGEVHRARGPVMFYEEGEGQKHFYRLCACSMRDRKNPRKIRHAYYYHYLGNRFAKFKPTLVPHRRLFK